MGFGSIQAYSYMYCMVTHSPSMMQFGKDAVGYLRVDVTDSGVGLSELEQRNVFGEFTQFNKNDLQGGGTCLVFFIVAYDDVHQLISTHLYKGGSGLGLWISRHIVHMHKVVGIHVVMFCNLCRR